MLFFNSEKDAKTPTLFINKDFDNKLIIKEECSDYLSRNQLDHLFEQGRITKTF